MTDFKNNLSDFDTPELVRTLDGWGDRCREARDGHYKMSEKLFWRAQVLGYVLIYCTIFVSVFSFFSYTYPIESSINVVLWKGITNQHIVIFIGMIAAVVSCITTQNRHGERAETHRSLGSRYANLARDIEALSVKSKTKLINSYSVNTSINEIITEWNNLSEDSLLTQNNKDGIWKIVKVFINVIIATFFTWMFYSVSTSITNKTAGDVIDSDTSTVINLNCAKTELPNQVVNAINMHTELYKK